METTQNPLEILVEFVTLVSFYQIIVFKFSHIIYYMSFKLDLKDL